MVSQSIGKIGTIAWLHWQYRMARAPFYKKVCKINDLRNFCCPPRAADPGALFLQRSVP